MTKTFNNLIYTKNGGFKTLVAPSETGKSQPTYNWLKNGTFQGKFTKIPFLLTLSDTLGCYAKKNRKPRVCSTVIFDFTDSLRTNGTKYLIIFDHSCEDICNSKTFVDISATGRHRGLIIFYIKHNLFHPSKHGRDVELQNTHIVRFESPRDVMQVSTLSSQLELGSELVDWYRDETCVPTVLH